MKQIFTLAGSAQVAIAIPCLESFLASVDEPMALIILDDGTLTIHDQSQLRNALPAATILLRQEREASVLRALSGFPLCTQFRKASPLGQKLFDPVINCIEKRVRFIDSDVFFRRRCTHLFQEENDEESIVMCDTQNAYAWTLTTSLTYRTGVVARCNTGLFSIPRARFQLDQCEALLRAFDVTRNMHRVGFQAWLEQSIIALLISQHGSVSQWRDNQIAVVGEGAMPLPSVACHFVSPVRHRFQEVVPERTESETNLEPIKLEFQPAERLSLIGIAAENLRRRVKRLTFSIEQHFVSR